VTRIGDMGAGMAGGRPLAPEELRRDLPDRSGQLPGGGTGLSRDGPGRETGQRQYGLDAGLAGDRQALFLDKVRRALGEDGTQDEGDDTGGPAQRLLAMAGETTAPRLVDGLPSPGGPAVADASGRTAGVVQLAERIERSLEGEMAAGWRSGVSLRLDLEDAGDGPRSLTLTMTATSIDVVLSPPEGGLPEDYALAAQALAERLQTRFSRRVVRIHEAGGQEAKASHGLDEISRLLSGRGERP
jgi:hypothetical protein